MVERVAFNHTVAGSIPAGGAFNGIAKRNCAGLITHRSLDRNQELLKDALII